MLIRNTLPVLLLTAAATLCAATADMTLSGAAMQGDRDAVRLLIAQGADVNAAQGDGMTALHWAAFKDDVDMARVLIKAGANVKAETRIDATTPLFMAARNGDAAMIDLLLYAGADAKSADKLGTTPLMMAAASGSADAVKVLLDHGADVNAKESAHGQTALMFAAAMNRAAAMKVLLARGADANIATKVMAFNGPKFDLDGNMIPDPAKGAANKEAAPKAEAGKDNAGPGKSSAPAKDQATAAKTSAKDATVAKAGGVGNGGAGAAGGGRAGRGGGMGGGFSRGASVTGGMTALLFAARDGQMDAIRTLVENGANINEVSGSEKMTPLVMAIANGHLDIGKYLLDRGADPNMADEDGLAALYATIDVKWAPHNWVPMPSTEQENTNYLDLMKDLLAHGANPNAQLTKKLWFRTMFSDQTWVDFVGATPFWRAAVSTDVAAMRLLKTAGADPNIRTKEGTTPLMVAAGLGWGANYSVTSPDYSFLDAVKYCVEVGIDVNAVDSKGNTALHGVASRGDNDLIKYLVAHGARTDLVSKSGDTVADMANGWREHSEPWPQTVALLEQLGSKNSHNCRSAQCNVEPDAFKNRTRPPGAGAPTSVLPDSDSKKPEKPVSKDASKDKEK